LAAGVVACATCEAPGTVAASIVGATVAAGVVAATVP